MSTTPTTPIFTLTASSQHVPTLPCPQAPMSFLEAVAREEGFYIAGTRPQRNNNPGDIEFGKFTQAHGATAGDPRFAVFPDHASGFAAMRALFTSGGYKGLTVGQALNRWAPPIENQTNAYIANVCKWTGLTPETIIDGILDGATATHAASSPSSVTHPGAAQPPDA